MDMLALALQAKLPFIHVKTDDLLHPQQVLAFISGEAVAPFWPKPGQELADQLPPQNVVFTTNPDLASPEVYNTFKEAKKTLVFINTKISVLQFVGGELLPPPPMVLALLKTLMPGSRAEDVLPCFGGMTLKDTFEIVKLTAERGKVSSQEINRTRQGYISKLKGITQVDTATDYYAVPSYLQAWMDDNLDFFQNPVHPLLTPRGLLLDGIPGTGKTEGAKYIAKTLGLPLYRMDVGSMKGKYVGDSEGNLNAALAQVDAVSPCVVILDEVEKVFTDNGDHGVTSSMLSTLLWWLQEHKTQVFTVMTTNKAESIPPELYRPGRIDKKMVFTGLEDKATAEAFAFGAYTMLAKQMPKKLQPLSQEGVALGLKLGGVQYPISQSKVVQQVYAMIKAILKGVPA